jgi:hypothetical protein
MDIALLDAGGVFAHADMDDQTRTLVALPGAGELRSSCRGSFSC